MKTIRYSPPPDTGLDIIFCDGELVLVDKPAGLLTVPGKGEDRQDCLLSRVQQRFPEARVCHRLDMETSGLLILALNAKIHRAVNRLFAARAISKHYEAVVEGQVKADRGEVLLPLRCDWPNRPRQMVDHVEGKPSRTCFNVLRRDPQSDSTRLQLQPETGRTHQLRVHMQALGHAILGDGLYAGRAARERTHRLLLHAKRLTFRHPVSGRALQFTSEVPF